MSGIMALKKGGKGGKKSAKFKKQAKKRYDERRANVQEQARSNQGSNNNNNKKTTTVLSPLEALIANKDKLVQQDAGDGVRNQYQVEMDNYKKGLGAYAGMDSKKNKEVFKERFPNPLIKIAKGIGDVYSKFSPMANIARALNSGNEKVKNFGPVKDSSNMIKDLSSMFGLDGLMGKLVNIAGGRDNNQFNEVIKNNQTSTAMRNNLAYGDPRGLNDAPIYRDPIMDMGLPNIDTSMEDQYRQFGSIDDKRRSIEKTMGFDTSGIDDNYIDRIYNSSTIQDRMNSVGDDKQAIEDSLLPGQFNFNTGNDINLSGDPDEIFEDVSETEYVNPVNPADIITQENITTGLSDTPLVDPSGVYTDGTPYYDADQTNTFNVGSFPKMDIFGNEVGGPRHHLLNQINKYGNTPSASEKESYDILNSLGQADGGYMSNFPNQNTAAPSVTASDNIDNRIMQNLQFEKMAPGMMGYNQGGKVMSTFEKLKAIADNNYG